MNEREQVFSAYESWLLRQPLAKNTQDAYRFHVRQYGEYLATRPATGDDPLRHPFARDYAVRDYKRYLKTERKAKRCWLLKWRDISAWRPPVGIVCPL